MTSTSALSKYEVTIRVGRTIHVWHRFAANAPELLASVQRAAADEPSFLGRKVTIQEWHEVQR
jgi:hypothetical protein